MIYWLIRTQIQRFLLRGGFEQFLEYMDANEKARSSVESSSGLVIMYPFQLSLDSSRA